MRFWRLAEEAMQTTVETLKSDVARRRALFGDGSGEVTRLQRKNLVSLLEDEVFTMYI